MGNSSTSSRSQHHRHFEDAAVQGNPIIRCEYVDNPHCKISNLDYGITKRPNDLNKLSLESSSLNSLGVVKEQASRHQVDPPSEKDVSTVPVDSTSSLSACQPNPLPVITVTRFGDQDKTTISHDVQNPPAEVFRTPEISQPQNQPGLTGVPRHKPVYQSPQKSTFKSRPHSSPRTDNIQPKPVRSQSTRCTHAENSPCSEQLISKSPPRGREVKVSQGKMINRERDKGSSPTVCKRSNSTGPYSRHPTPMNTPRRVVSRDVPKRTPTLPQSRLEYTFYIRDTEEHRKPFNENTADAIARGCQCSIELITLGKGFPPVIYKGIRVCPVTITTSNMTNLRKCLSRLDAHYPEFNAKAFLPR